MPFSPSLLALPAALALAWPGTAQSYRLNARFELESVVGEVHDFRVKANGGWVFFRAEERLPGVVELFTVPAGGGKAPLRENGYLRPDRSVVAFQPSPVGSWVAFVADQDKDDVFELYSRTVGDAKPRKLSGSMVTGGDVTDFAIAPDASRVVFRADRDADQVLELYSVPLDGSASPVRVSGPMVPSGDVGAYVISPCACHAVYVADQDTDEVHELYSAPLDGSAGPVKLSAPLPPNGNVWRYENPAITADGATVVYRADQVVTGVTELFRVPIDGSASPVRVNGALVPGGLVVGFVLSPDGTRAVYSADQDQNEVYGVYSAPLDGSLPAVKLSPPGQFTKPGLISPDSSWVALTGASGLLSVPIDGSAPALLLDPDPSGPETFLELSFSPDSSRLVYRTGEFCQQACYDWTSLRSVPSDGSASAVRLDDPGGIFQALTAHEPTPFAISADSTRVVYGWNDGTSAQGLYSVPIDRSAAPIALHPGPIGVQFATAPLGTRAFFLADVSGTGTLELHSVRFGDGSGLAKLSAALARDTSADVDLPSSEAPFALDPTGQRVVYAADPVEDEEFELFTVSADGRAHAVPLTGHRLVESFRISPDGERVVYRAGSPQRELYSAPASGGTAAKLNHVLPTGRSVAAFEITADGSHVVFQVSGGGLPARLFTVPIAGGASTIQLEDDLAEFALSPGTGRAVYTVSSSGPTGTQQQLFSVLDDGSAAPVALCPVLPGLIDFVISGDGSRVAFDGGTTLVPGSIKVYSVPVDGSASPIELSGSLPSAFDPRISPDGLWVVFGGADAGAEAGKYGLFSSRIDGSLGPVDLVGPLAAGGSVHFPFGLNVARISPDSSRVVYTADQEVDEVHELFSVPIDGSASPVKLNGPLASGGDVFLESTNTLHVQISPDGARVLYVADQEVDGVLELFSAPLGGGASPIQLSGALVPGGDVAVSFLAAAYRITPDSTRVVYAADQATDGLRELFLVPLDASLEPRKLNWPLAKADVPFGEESGGVELLRITPDSARVLYLATERIGVTELFASELDAEHGRARRR